MTDLTRARASLATIHAMRARYAADGDTDEAAWCDKAIVQWEYAIARMQPPRRRARLLMLAVGLWRLVLRQR